MAKTLHPSKEGWIRAEFTMKTSAMVSEEQAKQLASWGKPEDYEFGPITQYGKKVKVIYREKK